MKKIHILFGAFIGMLAIDTNLFAQETSFPLDDLTYRNVGPTRGGRVTAVTGVTTEPGTFYMGATGGGVWKTENYGYRWKNVSDGFFATPSIGAIRVAPSNPKVVYVGTGSDGIRSNIIIGKGVYKSGNSGKSWEHIGLEKVGQIGAVEIDPASPNRVFVAAIGNPFAPNPERGLFRTLDGGESWDKVFYHSDTVGVVDVEFAPGNSQIVYASLWRVERKPWTIVSGGKEGGVYKSTDGGDTWQKLGGGLPTGTIGKIDLAVSPANPQRLYALVEAHKGEGGLYLSEDQGESFKLMSSKKELLDRPFYYCNVDVNPQNARTVYINSTQFWVSYDSGKSWQRQATPHGDNHDIWIHPEDSLLCIQGNDGGANISRDGMKTWSTQNNQSTAELYQVEVDDRFPYWLYAGQQDNSTISVPSLPPYNSIGGALHFWEAVGGCETGPAVPKPGNPDIVYSNCKGRFGVYNRKTGQEKQYYVGASNMYGHNPKDLKFRFQRVSPIHVSPHNPDVIYHTSQFVHKTQNDGQSWETISPDLTAFTPETQVISGSPITRDVTGEEFYSTIYAIRESPLQEGVIWVGANDGPVHVTRDGGQNWANVTPKDLPPGGRVDAVEPSPHDPAKAYVSVLRYQLDDFQPYVYRTTDWGKSWQRITTGNNGVPKDYPVRVVREDPNQEGVLYAGTEYGMFISLDDGQSWQAFQQNLPVTPITDIKIKENDLILSTMGRGFWILDNLSPLYSWNNREAIALFPVPSQHRMYFRGTNPNAIPTYPSPGVGIDYYLPDSVTGSMELAILDGTGKKIRSFHQAPSSTDSTKKSEASMATGFRPLGSKTYLPHTAGHHRVKWDMRHESPVKRKGSKRNMGGPLVVPGSYTVQLTVGETQKSTPLEILADPRVVAEGVTWQDMKEQENLALQVRDLLSDLHVLEAEVLRQEKAFKKQLKAENPPKGAQRSLNKVSALKEKLLTAEGRYQTPMLRDQCNYLYYMLLQADQKPGQDALDRYVELKEAYESLKEMDLPHAMEGK